MKRGALMLALGVKPKGDASESKGSDGESSINEYARLAAEAMEDGDTKGVAKALKRLVRACVKEHDHDEDDED